LTFLADFEASSTKVCPNILGEHKDRKEQSKSRDHRDKTEPEGGGSDAELKERATCYALADIDGLGGRFWRSLDMVSRFVVPALDRALLAVVWSLFLAVNSPAARAHDPAAEMAGAAGQFIASLGDQQRTAALFEFSSDKRDFWHFIPDKFIEPDGKRYGLTIGQMTPQQRLLAHALLSSGLSHKGYQQSVTIMTLEAILHDLEDKNPIRDPELYYVSIFGKPSVDKTWAWRFEGHHVSINFTLAGGKLFSVTPSFFGTNPARVKAGPFKGLEVLAVEQNLARKLVKSFDDEQKKLAIIAEKAPRDIITSQDRRVNKGAFLPQRGIQFNELDPKQQAMLLALVNEYAAKYRPPILEQINRRTPIADGRDMVFAWAGGLEPGQGHYYRVQTPAFLFEYDNTQNDANHIHAVWRQFDGDFGDDLLRRHYETAPRHHGH